MRELTYLERWVAVGAGVVTILCGLAGLASMAGLLPRLSESREGTNLVPTEPTVAVQGKSVEEGEEATPGELGLSPPPAVTKTARPQPQDSPQQRASVDQAPIPRPSEFPVQAHLQDGQQHVMLGGDLGVSVSFSEVASTPIATLRINHEGTQEIKALLMEDTFTVAVRGARYRISVLRLNFEAREIHVQIDKVD